MNSNSKNEVIKLLSICGQIAEHKSEKMQEHNMDEAMLLKNLTDDEQNQLKSILNKLKTNWVEEHKKHHSGEH